MNNKEERAKATLAAWKEMGQWIVDGKPSTVNNVSFCIKDGELVIEPLSSYIELQRKEARIDEIKYLAGEDMIYIDMDSREIEERIAELTKGGQNDK